MHTAEEDALAEYETVKRVGKENNCSSTETE